MLEEDSQTNLVQAYLTAGQLSLAVIHWLAHRAWLRPIQISGCPLFVVYWNFISCVWTFDNYKFSQDLYRNVLYQYSMSLILPLYLCFSLSPGAISLSAWVHIAQADKWAAGPNWTGQVWPTTLWGGRRRRRRRREVVMAKEGRVGKWEEKRKIWLQK